MVILHAMAAKNMSRKRKSAYRPFIKSMAPRMLQAISLEERKGRFYVVFKRVALLHKSRSFSFSKPPFLAQHFSQMVLDWARTNGVEDVEVAGEVANFRKKDDAMLCRIFFS